MQNGKTVLITGATSGIGLSIATKLCESGFNVVGTSRSPQNHSGKFPFQLLELDVTSQASIDNCFMELFSKISSLDILISNAGSILSGNIEETPVEQARQQFETNFWGMVKVTKAVLPYMRQQRKGQIIATGSLLGLFGVPFSSYYAASKHAMEGFFKSLRFEVKKFNIHVSIIEPGFYKTNIGQTVEHIPAGISDYAETQTRMFQYFEEAIINAPSPEPVADMVLKIIYSKSPKYGYPIGSGSKLLPFLQFISYRLFENGFIKNAKL